MNKAIRIFLVCFFIAVGIKLIHDLIASNVVECVNYREVFFHNVLFENVHNFFTNKTFTTKLIDYLYGVSNTLFKLAPAIAVFILTRKLKDIRRVLIHLAFVLYLADLFDELFFNPYEYGVGEWLTAIIFYFIINRYYKNK
jgi:Na+/glutamate symporter